MKKWATTTAAMGLALATSLASTSATMLKLKQTMMAAERNRIQFNEYEVKPEAHYLLGEKAMAGTSDFIPCTTTSSEPVNSGNATIMIAISKCVSDANLAMIKDWVDSIKKGHATYVDADKKTKNLTFTTTLLPGECEARSERASRGYNDTSGYNSQTLLSDGTDYALYADVLPQEVERIQAFARFGRVLPAVADDKVPPVAVVSFVNNERSYDYIEQYESKHNISKTFNFQLCQNGTACGGNFENCIKLDENIDLFMYNPFQIVHSTECLSLEGGIPVTYLDENQAHKCYCKCPAGYEMDAYKTSCKLIDSDTCDCVWKQSSPSLHIDNTEKLDKCLFTNLSSCWHMAVPFPLDNYVSDYRNNSKDGTNSVADGPHVDLIVTRLSGTVFDGSVLKAIYGRNHENKALVIDNMETTKGVMLHTVMENGNEDEPASEPYVANGNPQAQAYEWKDYQRNRGAKIDSIELNIYGKFRLELKASDYFDSATCLGCVEVVDKFRPQNTTQCPVRVCDNSTSLCATSAAGVVEVAATPEYAKLKGLVDAVYEYRDKATNDACSTNRCDENTFSVKSWLQTDYKTDTDFDAGKKCLSEQELKNTFTASSEAKVNPLIVGGEASNNDHPVEAFHCKRCCKYGVQLKEWWVDYKCGYDYDVKSCDGDAPQCDFEQCVALNGDSLASAKAHIKDGVQTESKKVLASLGVDGFQTYTQVHHALPCTDFNAACNYTVSVTDLFEKSASLKFTDGDADSYVYWRYKIHDGDAAWQLWESATAFSFTMPATKITIEAWTACGRVRQFYFYVHLHAHSDIKVCDYFKGMWYQSTVSHLNASDTTALCAYPGSDFAELTFDYQANIGLQYAYDRLRMNVTGVQCDLAFEGKGATQILNVTGTSMDIIERYAVELQNLERTQKDTSFSVNCTFTYKQYGNSTLTHSCDRAFTIMDCDKPTIDTPDAECLWDDCAGQGKPGPYEVCSGNMVASTATATYMNTAEVECCQGCEKKTECTSILDLPVGRDIKRCVPPTTRDVYGEYGYEDYGDSTYTAGAYIASTPSLLAKAAASHPTAAAATVLLVASALVALVALVVVRQRRAAAAEAMVVEDAYYPLLH